MSSYELIKVCESPFASLPLFLPSNVTYDPTTNTVTRNATSEGENAENQDEPPPPHLVKVPQAGWDMLHNQLEKKHKVQSISVIACVGPYRTGKSWLASRFLRTSQMFPVGPTLEGCTVGIWISTTALVDTSDSNSKGCYKFILDVEGLGDPTSDDVSNTRLALACLLLSSVLLFNNTSHPDRGSLQFLRCLSTIRQRIAQPNAMPTQSSTSFVWVFRDFFLQLPIRKTSGKPYTLEEYVLERILTTTSTGGGAVTTGDVEKEIVHSLLNDFANLRVLKVGHPKLQGQQPLSPEEMAHLDEVVWETLDEGFRADMQHVITTCLELATPFQLGVDPKNEEKQNKGWNHLFSAKHDKLHVAKPKAYAKWCDTVLDVVNSSGVIPNLPDLQNQLVQQMAKDLLAQCVVSFQRDVETYWNSCPVYNNTPTADAAAASAMTKKLKSVAEDADLQKYAQECFVQQKNILSDGNISSPTILATTIAELEARCVAQDENLATATANGENQDPIDNVSSLGVVVSSSLTKIRTTNNERSRLACEALADSLYAPVQASIRDAPTSMPLVDFQQVVRKLEQSYLLQARGPAKNSVLVSHLQHPSKADEVFIAIVTERDEALQDSLNIQASLAQDIEKKESEVAALNQDLEKAHKDALAEALAAQHKQEEEQREALRMQMEEQLKTTKETAEKERQAKEAEMKRIKLEAEHRLKSEVEARDVRLEQEKQLFSEQIESLKESADTELQEKLALVESKSRQEHERLEAELSHRLEESENRLQEEIRVNEAELDETKKALEETKLAEQELKQRLERKICPDGCVML